MRARLPVDRVLDFIEDRARVWRGNARQHGLLGARAEQVARLVSDERDHFEFASEDFCLVVGLERFLAALLDFPRDSVDRSTQLVEVLSVAHAVHQPLRAIVLLLVGERLLLLDANLLVQVPHLRLGRRPRLEHGLLVYHCARSVSGKGRPTAKGGCADDLVDAHADQLEVALQVCVFVL